MSSKFKRTNRRRKLAVLMLVILLLAGVILAGWGAFLGTRQVVSQWSGSGGVIGPQIVEPTQASPAPVSSRPLPITPTGAAAGAPTAAPGIPATTLTPWDGAGRVTILVLGLDYRDWEKNASGASRSDTMVLLTLDPQARTAGVMSIPRDLWVSIPGFKHGKINTAYYLGDSYKMPGGGPALAVKTVENLLGVTVNYYAQVDFEAFVRFIDEIGGVEVDVPAPIKIDLLGDGNNTIKRLKAGKQVLPGDYALAYARNRHTDNGDFDRAARQQQVIMAIREKVLTLDMLPTLIAKAPQLYSQLAPRIRTNLTLDEVIRLALLAQTIPESSIKRGMINKDNVAFGFSPDGLSILVPYADDIQALRDEIFATSGGLGPQTAGSPQEQMKAEAGKILLYNGTRDASLGERAANYLRSQGANVTLVGQAEKTYLATTIVDHTGQPYALKYLVDLLKIAPARITIAFDPGASADIELYLGADVLKSGVIP